MACMAVILGQKKGDKDDQMLLDGDEKNGWIEVLTIIA